MTLDTDATYEPKVWIGSWADYNDGTLHGKWITLEGKTPEEIYAEIDAMLANSPYTRSAFARKWGMKAEEWGIFDYEGFAGIRVGEQESIERLCALTAGLTGDDPDAYAAYVKDTGNDDLDAFSDAFMGAYESIADFGERWFTDFYDLDKMHEDYGDVAHCIDWEHYGNELLLGGLTHCWHNGTLYVFSV